MSSHSEQYKHLVGTNVDEAIEILKADGMLQINVEFLFPLTSNDVF